MTLLVCFIVTRFAKVIFLKSVNEWIVNLLFQVLMVICGAIWIKWTDSSVFCLCFNTCCALIGGHYCYALLYNVCTIECLNGPRQTNLCLRAFRHDKFHLRMPSHSEGPGIWFSVWRFLLTHCLYARAAKVLARLRGCAGSPEPSLLA